MAARKRPEGMSAKQWKAGWRKRAKEGTSTEREQRSKMTKENPHLAQAKEQIRLLTLECARLKKQAVSHAVVREEILKIAHQKPPVPAWLVKPKRGARCPGVPTLFASDWHWGEVVEAGQVGGVNSYDLETAHRRAQALIKNTVDLLTQHMVNPDYPGIVFALGGDMFSGDIHEELSRTNEAPIMPLVLDLYGVLVKCIETLADTFGAVFVPCVTGNHSRTTPKMTSKERNHLSFDWLLYSLLDKHFERDARVTFLIPEGTDAIFRIYGHTYCLTHGDQFRGGDGLIGCLGPILRGDHKKRSRNGQIGLHYDTLLLGHWHQLIQTQRVIVNGSLIGYNEYASQGNFGFEIPQQALWITHQEKGITFQMAVKLESKDPISKESDWVSWRTA
jgi:hypothetical protein